MRLFRSKSIIVLLAFTLVLMFASTATATPGSVTSDVKTGFYVYDSTETENYTYYSMPYVLDPANFTDFLSYKDSFADDTKFIWVNSDEQFVSIANWDNGPANITNIVNDLGSATYYDKEKGVYLDLVLGVQVTASNPTKTGFSLALSRAVAGLDDADLTIKDSSNVPVTGVSISNPSSDNKNFNVACSLIPGQTYTLEIAKADFAFGEKISIDVPTEVIAVAAPVVINQSKTGFTLVLLSADDSINFKDNFMLQDQYGNQITINSATSSGGGSSYVFSTGTMIRERTYTLTPINNRYSLSSPVSFVIAPVQVSATIQDVTINDLVVKLAPGVDDIPSANFYLRDSSNNRLLSMVLATTGSPTTDYKIGAFPYLIAGDDYSIEISMPEYDFGEAKSVKAGQKPVALSVSSPTTTGFTVALSPAVTGLTAASFSLKNTQNATVPFAVSTADGGATYVFKADIIAGSTYKISAAKNGFDFGAAQDVLAPVVMVGGGAVNGNVYVYLNGVLSTVPAAGDFTITRSIDGVAQANVIPTAVSQNTTTRILALTVPQIAATGADQVVTGTVSYAGVTKNYSFTVPSSPVPVAAGITSITAPAQDATTLTLPAVPAGFTIEIKTSSNPAVIATDGTIIPPASTTTVNLVLTVTKTVVVPGTPTTADTVSIPVVVPGSPTTVASGLTIANPAAGATTLTLPTVPAEYTVAIKTSDNTNVIALNGTITPPFNQTDVVLTLEVTKTANSSTALTGNLTVTVPQAPAITAINAASTGAAMQTALGNAGAFLTLTSFNALSSADKLTAANAVLSNRPVGGYASQAALQAALDNAVTEVANYNAVAAAKATLAIGYEAGDSAAGITQDITLPTELDGVAISWASDNAAISADGTVTRPSFTAGDTAVVLTATLTKGAASDTKTFNVTVTKLPQTEAEAVAQLNAAADVAAMQTAITNPQLGLTITGYNALSAADKATVANAMLTGKPVGGYADKAAIQTALDTNVTNLANLNAVAAAKAALEIGYGPFDSAEGITQNIALYIELDEVDISWASDNAAIAPNGIVTRPSFTAGDTAVVLTATLTKGTASDTKVFNVIVTKLPQTAQEVADAITTITAPAKDATALTLPTVPDGFSIAVKTSSNESVIATGAGTITPPLYDTSVDLVLEVTRTFDGTTFSTVSISVTVPARTSTISDISAAKNVGKIKFKTNGVVTASDLAGKVKATAGATTVDLVNFAKPSQGTEGLDWNAEIPLPAYDTTYTITAAAPFTVSGNATVSWASIKVTSITVTGAGGATTIETNKGTLQMSAEVLPANATDPSVTWSVTNGTGEATISATGLLTAKENGTVTVKATAQDGSNVVGELVITITGQLAEITLADLEQSGVIVDDSLIVFNGPYGLTITLASLQSQFPKANMDSTVTITIEGIAYTVPKNALGDANFVGELPYILTPTQIMAGVINVVIPKSTAKDITAFSFTSPAATGTISGTNIEVTVPFGTNVTALVATFTNSDLATVEVGSTIQVSGTTANNFSSPVSYVVTAEDGSTKTYTVTVTIAPPTLADLGTTGVIIDNSLIVFNGPYGLTITLAALQTVFPNANMDSTVTITIDGIEYPVPKNALGDTNFVGELPYTLTPEQISEGFIKVVTPKSTAKDITAFSFVAPAVTGTISGTDIEVTVPFGTEVTALIANFTNSNLSTVKVNSIEQVSGTTVNDFSSPVAYVVTAEDGSTKTYTVTVTVEPPTLAQLGTEGVIVDNSLIVFNGPYGLTITLDALRTAYPSATMDSIVKIEIEGTKYDVPKNALGDTNFVGELPYTLDINQINSGIVTIQ